MKPILILLLFFSSQIAIAGSVQSVRTTDDSVIFNSRDGSSREAGFKNDWQRVDGLATNFVADQTVVSTFNGLEIGKIYTVNAEIRITLATSNKNWGGAIKHNGNVLARGLVYFQTLSGSSYADTRTFEATFEATTSTVDLVQETLGSAAPISGSWEGSRSWWQIRERNDLNPETDKYN